jgi:hypothetical protein
VLLVDEDVGHAALVGHLLEGVLDIRAVICNKVSIESYLDSWAQIASV